MYTDHEKVSQRKLFVFVFSLFHPTTVLEGGGGGGERGINPISSESGTCTVFHLVEDECRNVALTLNAKK